MMLRIIAFIANAHERLQFTKGLSDDDVPDLWQKSYSDEILAYTQGFSPILINQKSSSDYADILQGQR